MELMEYRVERAFHDAPNELLRTPPTERSSIYNGRQSSAASRSALESAWILDRRNSK